MPAHDIDEGGIAFSGPDRRQMADQPDGETDDPKPQAETDRGGQRAIDDGDRARRATEQNWFRERAVDWGVEAGDLFCLLHQISAPPPKEKNDRKKLEAAKAIDNPKTI